MNKFLDFIKNKDNQALLTNLFLLAAIISFFNDAIVGVTLAHRVEKLEQVQSVNKVCKPI